MPQLLSYTLRDAAGLREAVPFYLTDDTTLADAQSWSDVVAAAMDDTTGSVIESASIRLSLTLPGGIKTDPTDDYLNREGGLFGFNVDGSPLRWSVRIPAYLKTLSSGLVIPNTGATAALITAILAETDAVAVNEFEYDLTGFIAGKVSTHTK